MDVDLLDSFVLGEVDHNEIDGFECGYVGTYITTKCNQLRYCGYSSSFCKRSDVSQEEMINFRPLFQVESAIAKDNLKDHMRSANSFLTEICGFARSGNLEAINKDLFVYKGWHRLPGGFDKPIICITKAFVLHDVDNVIGLKTMILCTDSPSTNLSESGRRKCEMLLSRKQTDLWFSMHFHDGEFHRGGNSLFHTAARFLVDYDRSLFQRRPEMLYSGLVDVERSPTTITSTSRESRILIEEVDEKSCESESNGVADFVFHDLSEEQEVQKNANRENAYGICRNWIIFQMTQHKFPNFQEFVNSLEYKIAAHEERCYMNFADFCEVQVELEASSPHNSLSVEYSLDPILTKLKKLSSDLAMSVMDDPEVSTTAASVPVNLKPYEFPDEAEFIFTRADLGLSAKSFEAHKRRIAQATPGLPQSLPESNDGFCCLKLDGPMWSRGSANHPDGCVPCKFFCYCFGRNRGCNAGSECLHCHQEHVSNHSKKLERYRKEVSERKIARKREKEAALAQGFAAKPNTKRRDRV